MKVINATRDQLHEFSSCYGNRFVSLDCNDSENKTKGIEIAVPRDIHDDELELCRENVIQTYEFFQKYGWDTPIRRGDGILTAGHSGVIHTEHYFIYNETPRLIILENASEYADILINTLGRINGMSFILPHTKRDPGASSLDGYTERELAKYTIMPILLDRAKQGLSLAQARPSIRYTIDHPTQVNWEEDIRPA